MLDSIKHLVKSAPIVGSSLAYLRGDSFTDSAKYWEQRYRTGGNSGAGSYCRLAEFKAEVVALVDGHPRGRDRVRRGAGIRGRRLTCCFFWSLSAVEVRKKSRGDSGVLREVVGHGPHGE